jgi:hypothetical protein
MIIRRIVPALLVAGLLAAGATWIACQGPSSGAGGVHVVRVDGAVTCNNASLSWLLWTLGEPGKRPAFAAVRDGDLLLISVTRDEGFSVRYRATDGDALSVAFDAGRGMLGGKTVSLWLNEAPAWDWLARASAEEQKALRIVDLRGEITADRAKVLQDLAKVNPNIDLVVNRDADKGISPAELAQALAAFRPRFLTIDLAMLKDPKPLLPMLSAVEALSLAKPGETPGSSLEFLTQMPRLRTLWLQDGLASALPLPANLENLRSLNLGVKDLKHLASIDGLTNLEELHLVGDDLIDISALSKFAHLRVLSLAGCSGVTDLSPLKGLRLEWLALPPTVTQEQFNAIVAEHPGLAGLEIVAAGKKTFEHLRSIEPVKKLRNLKFLFLPAFEGAPQAAEDLKPMTGLRMLVLPPDFYEEKEAARLQDLQKALPNTVVTEGSGLCLGSGWILALVPVVAIAAALAAWRRRRTAEAP